MEISVVTAVYNGEEYLDESIESILKQTYSHFEYIIVNDGSVDKTKEILDNIKDSRVKVIHLERNVGAANALNIGINEARGKWIALQDADDVSIAHRLEMQINFIQSDPRLVVVGSYVQCIPENDQINQKFIQWEESFFNNKKNFRKEQFYSTPLCNGTGFFLKSAFEEIGGYDPTFNIAYDYDLWTRMFEVGEISRVPEILYKYRVRKQSLAHRNKIDTRNEVLLSTYKNISELRFNYLSRKPKFLLLGTQKDYEFYRNHLEIKNHYMIMSFPDPEVKDIHEEAYSLYRSHQIDGIIITSKKRRLLRKLRRSGLSFGKNLFMVKMH